MKIFVRSVLCGLVLILLAAPRVSADHCRRVVAQPVYSQAIVDYGQNVIVEPYAIKVYQPLQAYTSVGDEFRQAYFVNEIAKALYEIIRAEKTVGPSPPQTAPTPASPAKEQLAVQPVKLSIRKVLQDRCATCHNGKTGHVDLSGDPDKVAELDRLRSLHSVVTGKMPKGKPQLTQEELNIIADWSAPTAKK